ncbi:MAG: S8 family serine peptidase [Propionibacteriaceae bacterium]|nr:S8 family serine peptidase [Propionibacteriaceae bacterium]
MRTARLTAAISAAAVVLLSLPATPSAAEAPEDQTIIVTLDRTSSDTAQSAQDAVEAAGVTVSDARPISDRSVAVTVAHVSEAKAQAVGETVADQHGVTAARPARRAHAAVTDDTWYTDLWNLNAATGSTYGVDAEDAWPKSTGSGVVIGVVDTGMTKHSDLSGASSIVAGNVIKGYDFISDPDNAGDGNGADDDPSDEGDYTNDEDSSWHGTHVAGIIAALRNAEGVVGVAPQALIEPLRVLGREGGSEDDIVAAITWGAGLPVPGMPTNPRPASVLNLSLSGGGYSPDPADYECGTAMQTAINAAVAHGTAIVVPAGNGTHGDALRYSFPANCSNVIRVTATGPDGTLADYSNYGTSDYPATLAAPGTGILSTYNSGATVPAGEDYDRMSGTSMAVPHVTGTIALLRAARPGLSVAEVVNLMKVTSRPTRDGCPAVRCGAGIVDAAAAVAAVDGPTTVGVSIATPVISGKARVGSPLTASVGAWSPSSETPTWQWLRDGVPIAGQVRASYTPVAADKDKALSVRATLRYFDATTSGTSASVTIAGLPFTSQARPKISGTFKVGRKLTVKVGTVKPAATGKSYQWLRNGTAITKATHSTYRLVKADRRKKISVKVTVSRAGYLSRSATSSSHKVK